MSAKLFYVIIATVLLSFIAYGAKKVSFIDQSKCIRCGTCFKNCPVKAISKIQKDGKISYVVDPKKCIACGLCVKNCPKKAPGLIDPSAPSTPAVKKTDSTSTTVQKNSTAKAVSSVKDSSAGKK